MKTWCKAKELTPLLEKYRQFGFCDQTETDSAHWGEAHAVLQCSNIWFKRPSQINPAKEKWRKVIHSFIHSLTRDRVSLCSFGCPGTHDVDQAGLELEMPASAPEAWD